jgi:hypothetical protein
MWVKVNPDNEILFKPIDGLTAYPVSESLVQKWTLVT